MGLTWHVYRIRSINSYSLPSHRVPFFHILLDPYRDSLSVTKIHTPHSWVSSKIWFIAFCLRLHRLIPFLLSMRRSREAPETTFLHCPYFPNINRVSPSHTISVLKFLLASHSPHWTFEFLAGILCATYNHFPFANLNKQLRTAL